MKQVNYIYLLLFYLFSYNISYSQNVFNIQFRYGIQNHIPHGLPTDLKNSWKTSSNHFDLFLIKQFNISDHYGLNYGLGLSTYKFFNPSLLLNNKPELSNYGVIKYAVSRSLLNGKIDISVDVLHNLFLHKEKQNYDQKRVFTNLEIGINYKISNRFNISIRSPFSIYPMFVLRTQEGDYTKKEPVTTYFSSVRNFGINIGVTYSL